MSFQDTWPTATVTDDQDRTEPPEPGLYTVAVTDAKALTSKKGEDWVIIELRGLDGRAADHTWSLLQGFKTQQAAGFTKRVCRDLGVDIDNVQSLADLDQQLKYQIGRYFTVEVKQNGEYRNTYIQGTVSQDSFTVQGHSDVPATDPGEVQQRLGDAQERLAGAAPAPVDDEDIPF